ncbi:M16 family metallopeptidase [Sulfuriroseicoccus oceanibius]|uniref:Insulinase family protein n=1 Tax=Sulfuriroseicoccus oceanibius TaxID=2707525 RepID=A0A6B3L2L2_9BACT|nr:pitrilysin family protein [Sulfuriroseicoccus oceanibius]QQL43956.1 insulinase family protein [Sulfuriroseicoccus oceanibius]
MPESATASTFALSPRTKVLRLENGLEVLVLPDHRSPVVSVQGWVKVGSIHESEFLGGGISHLIEHLVFKGTTNFGGQEIAKCVQENGGQLNAYTSFDRTVYWVDAPSDGAERALDVVTDLIFRPKFPENEFEKEKEVIRREIAMGEDDPDRVLSQALFREAFTQHPTRHPVIGYLDAFNQLTLDNVWAFYRRHYVPNNVFLVIVGDITAEQAEAWVREKVGDVPRGMREPVMVPSEPRQLSARNARIGFDSEVTRVDLAWRIPSMTHPDMPVFDVLAKILGRGRSSRLYREIREKRKLAHSVGAWSYTPAHEGLFVLNADTTPDNRDALVYALRDEVEKVVRDGVTSDELEKARRSVQAGLYGGLVTTNGLASQIGSSWMLTGGVDLASSYLEAIEKVDSEAIQRVAAKWLVPSSECLVTVEPESAVAESTEAAAAIGERSASLMPAVNDSSVANGLNVLVGADHTVPLVSLQAAFIAGSQADPAGKSGLCRLVASSLLKGTATRTGEQLVAEIEGLGGSITSGAGNNTISVGAMVMRDDLPLALELLGDVLTHSTFPEEMVANERTAQLQMIKEAADHPVRVAMREARAALYGGSSLAHSALGTEAEVATLGRDDVAGFASNVLTASNGVLAVFGDADASEVQRHADGFIGGLVAGNGRASDVLAATVAPATTAQRIELQESTQQGVVVIAFPGPGVGHPDYLPMQLLNQATSDMASRLFLRIREEQGLAYYVSSTTFLGIGGGMFSFYLGTDPAKLAHAESELREEIKRLVEVGLDEDEFDRARASFRGDLIMGAQSPASLGTKACVDQLLGLGWNAVDHELERLKTITLGDVRAAAARWLHGEGVTVTVQP